MTDITKRQILIFTILVGVFVLSVVGICVFDMIGCYVGLGLCLVLILLDSLGGFVLFGLTYTLYDEFVFPDDIETHRYSNQIIIIIDKKEVFSIPPTSEFYYNIDEHFHKIRKRYEYNIYNMKIYSYSLVIGKEEYQQLVGY